MVQRRRDMEGWRRAQVLCQRRPGGFWLQSISVRCIVWWSILHCDWLREIRRTWGQISFDWWRFCLEHVVGQGQDWTELRRYKLFHTCCYSQKVVTIINNYSSGPNGLWVNSSWEIRDFKGKPLSSKFHKAFFTHVAISYTNLMPKKTCIKKRVQLPRDFLGAPTPPFHCFGTPKKLFWNTSVFTWRHGSHISVPKQWNGGHVGVPNKSCGNWVPFLCKRFLLFQ